MHTTKAPQTVPSQGFRIACLPAQQSQDTDKHLAPYAQLVHATFDEKNPDQRWNCYFRFSPKDFVCVPKKVAEAQNLTHCPQFPAIDGTPDKRCYILNDKHKPLMRLLQQQPPVSMNVYTPGQNIRVKSWQEVRDALLGKE